MTSILASAVSALSTLEERAAVTVCCSKQICNNSNSRLSSLMNWVLTGRAGDAAAGHATSQQQPQQKEGAANETNKQKPERDVVVIRLFDPHFHIWDMGKCHDPKILAPFAEDFFTFHLDDLEKLINQQEQSNDGGFKIELCGGIHIEAIARDLDGVREMAWVKDQLKQHHHNQNQNQGDSTNKKNSQDQNQNQGDSTNKKNSQDRCSSSSGGPPRYFPSGYVNLLDSREKVERILKQFVTDGVVSVRQILNHEPSWPFVERDMLLDETWLSNFQVMETSGMRVFELQCNPHQLGAATRLAQRYPRVNFVFNHLACLAGKDAVDGAKFSAWASAIANLAASCPQNVFMKISMMDYAFDAAPGDDDGQKHWSTAAVVRRVVGHCLHCFGPKRCMLASNHPVSLLPLPPSASSSSSSRYMESARVWGRWVASLLAAVGKNNNDDDVDALCRLTAYKAYRI